MVLVFIIKQLNENKEGFWVMIRVISGYDSPVPISPNPSPNEISSPVNY